LLGRFALFVAFLDETLLPEPHLGLHLRHGFLPRFGAIFSLIETI